MKLNFHIKINDILGSWAVSEQNESSKLKKERNLIENTRPYYRENKDCLFKNRDRHAFDRKIRWILDIIDLEMLGDCTHRRRFNGKCLVAGGWRASSPRVITIVWDFIGTAFVEVQATSCYGMRSMEVKWTLNEKWIGVFNFRLSKGLPLPCYNLWRNLAIYVKTRDKDSEHSFYASTHPSYTLEEKTL